MKLVIIIGGGASGKMTVGQELCKITGLRLFHNHMTIDLVTQVFGYFEPETILTLRQTVFENYAKSDNYGMVFTYIWDFSSASDGEYIKNVKKIFETLRKGLGATAPKTALSISPASGILNFPWLFCMTKRPAVWRACRERRGLKIISG